MKLDNVFVPQRLQQLNLAHGSNGEAVLLALHPYALERHFRVIYSVDGFVHLAESALTNLANDCIDFAVAWGNSKGFVSFRFAQSVHIFIRSCTGGRCCQAL